MKSLKISHPFRDHNVIPPKTTDATFGEIQGSLQSGNDPRGFIALGGHLIPSIAATTPTLCIDAADHINSNNHSMSSDSGKRKKSHNNRSVGAESSDGAGGSSSILNKAVYMLRDAASSNLAMCPLHLIVSPSGRTPKPTWVQQAQKRAREGLPTHDDAQESEFDFSKLGTSCARNIAWHQSGVLAVVKSLGRIAESKVSLYRMEEVEPFQELRHALQIDAQAVSWVPKSTPVCAVGCKGYVLLWSISTSLSDVLNDKDASTVKGVAVLYGFPTASVSVTHISFSPFSGRYMTLSSEYSTLTTVCDISVSPSSPESVVNEILTLRGSVNSTAWSPDDTFLAQSFCRRTELIVYSTSDWKAEQWDFKGPVRNLQWVGGSSGVSSLLVSVEGGEVVYVMTFTSQSPSSGKVTYVLNFQPYIVRSGTVAPYYVGSHISPATSPDNAHGRIQIVRSSVSGRRLAIALEDGHIAILRQENVGGSTLSGVTSTSVIRGGNVGGGTGPITYAPVGYVRIHSGVPFGVSVVDLQFIATQYGEVMAVLWEDDTITFTPFYFDTFLNPLEVNA